MRAVSAGLVAGLLLFSVAGVANADLVVIGEVLSLSNSTHQANLVWQSDNNGNSIVWLNFVASSNFAGSSSEVNFVNAQDVNILIDPTYNVTWTGAWRLPSAGPAPSAGYYSTASEMGHLVYAELQYPTSQSFEFMPRIHPLLDYPGAWTYLTDSLNEQGPVLSPPGEPPVYAESWCYDMRIGYLGSAPIHGPAAAVVVVRNATVTLASAVPEPTTLALFGLGAGALALRRRRRKTA